MDRDEPSRGMNGAAQWAPAKVGLAAEPAALACNAWQTGNPETADKPWRAAIQLSVNRAVPLPGIGVAGKTGQNYACLYGVYSEKPFRPRIPDEVALWGYLQTLVSTILVFLALLAVRNHFRIK